MTHKLLAALFALFLPVVATAQTGGSAPSRKPSTSSTPASHSIGTPASGTSGHSVGTAASGARNTTPPARPVTSGATTVHAIGMKDPRHGGPHAGAGKPHGRRRHGGKPRPATSHFIGTAAGTPGHRPAAHVHTADGAHRRHVVHRDAGANIGTAAARGTAPRGNVGNALPAPKSIGTAGRMKPKPAGPAPKKNVGKALPAPKSIGNAGTSGSAKPSTPAGPAPKKNVGKALPAPKSIGTGGGGAQSVPSAGSAPKAPLRKASPIGNAVGTGSHAQHAIGSAVPAANRKAVQCKGIMQDGTRCTRMTADASGYCPSHRK